MCDCVRASTAISAGELVFYLHPIFAGQSVSFLLPHLTSYKVAKFDVSNVDVFNLLDSA